jgi:cell division protein FtsZ
MLVTPGGLNPVAKIKVVGVGGAGGNTLNTMIADYNIEGVEFYAFNSDAQALKNSLAPTTLQLGAELTRGLGVGGDPSIGAQAAEESLDEIHEHLAGADMVFITAGMGGGTGTGAAAVVAGVAKNLGALTIAVVTKPFRFEGKHRERVALEGIAELKDKVDTLIVVPNQRLLDVIDDSIGFLDAMKEVDKVLSEGVKSISSLVTYSGFINVDFADVKAIMTGAGTSLMGMGRSSGENRAENAARQATSSPLLDLSIEGATGVLFNVVGGTDLSMREVDDAAQMIAEAVDPDANVIFGATIDPEMKDEIVITIVATGFDKAKQVHTPATPKASASSSTKLFAKDEPTAVMQDDTVSTESNGFGKVNDVSIPDTDVDDITEPVKEVPPPTSMDESDPLEVPSFMRRKK